MRDALIDVGKRIFITIGILLFVRIGNYIPVPGLNPKDLADFIQTNNVAQTFVNTISAKHPFIIGIFTLGIFPYINASIFIQLIINYSPYLAKLQKERDLRSRRSINQLTRFATLIWAIIQSFGIGFYFKSAIESWNIFLLFQIVLWLTTGAMIILWFSEFITDYGIGNGPSIFIFINIIANSPNIIKLVLTETINKSDPKSIIIIICFGIISLIGFILLQNGIRKIPIRSSREFNLQIPDYYAKMDNYIPLKLNQAGIIPIILATTVLLIPRYIFNFDSVKNLIISLLMVVALPETIAETFSNIIYWICYFGFILKFSSFYSTISLNPKSISDQLQKTASTITDCRPGPFTTFYLNQVAQRLNTIGSSMLAILATLPNIAEIFIKVSSLAGLSATSLLIVVGVVFDITREIKDILLSSIYKQN